MTASDPNPSSDYNFWIEENENYNDFTLTVWTTKASKIKDKVHFFI